jgi:hypothetical protein
MTGQCSSKGCSENAQKFIFQTAFSVLFGITELKGFSELSRNDKANETLTLPFQQQSTRHQKFEHH